MLLAALCATCYSERLSPPALFAAKPRTPWCFKMVPVALHDPSACARPYCWPPRAPPALVKPLLPSYLHKSLQTVFMRTYRPCQLPHATCYSKRLSPLPLVLRAFNFWLDSMVWVVLLVVTTDYKRLQHHVAVCRARGRLTSQPLAQTG